MSTPQEQPALFKSGEHSREASLHLRIFTPQERFSRAAKTCLGYWLLAAVAAVSFFAPLIHLVVATLLLVAGPVMGYRRYNMASIVERANGQCPACREEVEVQLEANERLPKWTYCPKCEAPLQVTTGAAEPQQENVQTAQAHQPERASSSSADSPMVGASW